MREKIKDLFEKKSDETSNTPNNEKGMCDKLADGIKTTILAFLNAIGPVWNFLFVKTPDPDDSDKDEQGNEISQDVIKKVSNGRWRVKFSLILKAKRIF